ncbi:MAG: zf-HC2 domain-containing protein [Opitutaceae bacterium]|nr:zf-HC2 domain-containing protein [Opitutaceae bacterium]
MNCRDIGDLLLAENDGRISPPQQAALTEHLAGCAACREQQRSLREALAEFVTDAARVPIPDPAEEWRRLQARLPGQAKVVRRRRLAPVVWFGASLAAAAAITLAYLGSWAQPLLPLPASAEVAQADFVEAGDANASTLVYVDKESGWLVVWAAASPAQHNG